MRTEPEPLTDRLTARVVKGGLWSFAGQIAPLIVQLATTPIVIRQLGPEAYGVLALLVIIPQYLNFADVGMSVASTKFGAIAYSDGDPDKEARVIRTATLIAFAGSAPVSLILAVFSREVAVLFNVPERLLGEASLALKFAAAAMVLTLLGYVLNSPQLSRLRMDLNALVTSGTRIAVIIATPIAIHLGYGIVGASFVIFAGALLNLACHIVVSFRLLPQLAGLSIDLYSLRPMIRFGWPMALASIAIIAIANIDRSALSILSSVTELAYYSVAFALASILTFASGSLYQSLVPVFSQLQANKFAEERNSIFSRTVRLVLVAMIPLVAVVGIIAEAVILIIAGPEFAREGIHPFYILLIGIAFNVGAYIPAAALVSTGRTDLLARMYWFELVPYVLLLWVLISRFGAVGAAAAWSIRTVSDALLMFVLANKYAGVRLMKAKFGAITAAGFVAAAPFLLYLIFHLHIVSGLVLASFMLPIYAAVVWRKVLDRAEANMLLDLVRSTFRRTGVGRKIA